MDNERKISRRDWFRLSKLHVDPAANQARLRQSIGNQSPDLQAVPHPVNHDGMDLSELPPMCEAILTADQVQQLISDIQALASNVLLMQRSPSCKTASASRATTTEQLRNARDALLEGSVPRVQIRYQWQETHWIDTLENRSGKYRLVRIAHRADTPSS
jgi:hypothetical protein